MSCNPKLLGQLYRLYRPLADGATGVVYRGLQVSVGRPVAIKVMHGPVVGDPDIRRRLLRDARLIASFAHPNIVHVHDYGTTPEGIVFVVMELLHGNTLAQELAMERPFAPRRALEIAVQIADALDAAHQRAVLHRRLTPNNVFLLFDPLSRDRVKLVDFGLSRRTAYDAHDDLRALGGVLHLMVGDAPPRTLGRLVDALLAKRLESAAVARAQLQALIDQTTTVELRRRPRRQDPRTAQHTVTPS
ncbi:MAG: serine/threonine-protein kinase [Acidobacteriota bacterium]